MHLFAYGTLMCPEIMRRIAGFLPEQRSASLEGYRRTPLAGVDYPAIVPWGGATVAGLLYLDLPPESWPRLDEFEDEIYLRREVAVLVARGQLLTAETYVLRPEHAGRLVNSEWSYDNFLREGRSRFEREYCNFPVPHS